MLSVCYCPEWISARILLQYFSFLNKSYSLHLREISDHNFGFFKISLGKITAYLFPLQLILYLGFIVLEFNSTENFILCKVCFQSLCLDLHMVNSQDIYCVYSIQLAQDCDWVEKYIFPVMWYKSAQALCTGVLCFPTTLSYMVMWTSLYGICRLLYIE